MCLSVFNNTMTDNIVLINLLSVHIEIPTPYLGNPILVLKELSACITRMGNIVYVYECVTF